MPKVRIDPADCIVEQLKSRYKITISKKAGDFMIVRLFGRIQITIGTNDLIMSDLLRTANSPAGVVISLGDPDLYNKIEKVRKEMTEKGTRVSPWNI